MDPIQRKAHSELDQDGADSGEGFQMMLYGEDDEHADANGFQDGNEEMTAKQAEARLDAQPPKRAIKAPSALCYTGGHHTIPEPPIDPRQQARVYRGPKIHDLRNQAIRAMLFGPRWEGIRLIWDIEQRFGYRRLLPPRHAWEESHGLLPSPWVPDGFEAEQVQSAMRWFSRLPRQAPARSLPALEGERLVLSIPGHLAVLVGPNGKQEEIGLRPGSGMACSPSGLPVKGPDPIAQDNTPQAYGWLFDVGGLVLELGWAPTPNSDTDEHPTQLLAVAAVPFSDYDAPAAKASANANGPTTDKTQGWVQFWEFTGNRPRDSGAPASPSTAPPRLIGVKCFDWGRPKRMAWCPVPMEIVGSRGMLAVLCGDGKVRVLDVRLNPDIQDVQYECMESPVVCIGQLDDDNSEATCLAWINVNRIVLGHRDGSITLWSLHPRRLLQRTPVHVSRVLDVCSGYPSQPHLVASIPVGGSVTLTDLTQPTAAMAYLPVPTTKFQPGLLCWSEIVQAFIAAFPTNTTCLTIMHSRMFCRSRRVLTLPSIVTCTAMGATHPILLAGSADGSVWTTNIITSLFRERRNNHPGKLRVFEAEFRPLTDGRLRGAVRFLHGFVPEINEDPRRTLISMARQAKEAEAKKKQSKEKKEEGHAASPASSSSSSSSSSKQQFIGARQAYVVHEPLTRITALAWNPNLDFSCWAACALGSGLVRVMDLGVS